MKKMFILRAIDLQPGLSNDHDGVPFRWLTSLVEKVRALVPDDEEGTCVVRGASGLTFAYEHTLTQAEELQSRLDDMESRAAQIKSLLPRDGALSVEQTQQLRELLGA